METWLRCTITPGQFDNEVGVDGIQFDQKPFSLFAPKNYTKADHEPVRGESVEGWIRVQVLEREDDLVLVHLPRQTFQSGPYITVRRAQLETVPAESAKRQKHKAGRR